MSVNRAVLPAPLYTADQTRSLDRIAIEEFGIPGIRLMQRAGHAVFAEIVERFPGLKNITILAGAGNNGGDGFIVALLARQKSIDVQLICVGPENFADKLQGEAKQAWQLLSEIDGSYELYAPSITMDGELIVDALLGTGLSGNVRGDFKNAIKQINELSRPVIAVDIPSGICADSGKVLGMAVEADITISFIGLNRGLLTGDAVDYCGLLLFDDLKVPADVYLQVPTTVHRTTVKELARCFPRRDRSSHKGKHGHLLIVGGNLGMGGAALLASEAGIRSGAGLVSLATRAEHVAASLSRCPEVMCHSVETVAELKPLIFKADVVVIGPGLGNNAWSEQMLREVLTQHKKVVLDADALNLMVEKDLFNPGDAENWIFTPHPGEASRILDKTIPELLQDRFQTVLELQSKCGGTVILKGAGSLSTGGKSISLCDKGNPGMAVGGMGDVLSGICGAFMCQGLSAEVAARMAVYVHAAAADEITAVQGEIGLIPSDLCKVLPRVINNRNE
ncbi:MAG: NAD(P)H-hydrate dehydratase [Neptuniibacter sp.]